MYGGPAANTVALKGPLNAGIFLLTPGPSSLQLKTTVVEEWVYHEALVEGRGQTCVLPGIMNDIWRPSLPVLNEVIEV